MITEEKPSLDEDLLVHFGVPGMKWGKRKLHQFGVEHNISKSKVKTTTAVGAATVASILYATGTHGIVAKQTGKIAFKGAKIVTKAVMNGTITAGGIIYNMV